MRRAHGGVGPAWPGLGWCAGSGRGVRWGKARCGSCGSAGLAWYFGVRRAGRCGARHGSGMAWLARQTSDRLGWVWIARDGPARPSRAGGTWWWQGRARFGRWGVSWLAWHGHPRRYWAWVARRVKVRSANARPVGRGRDAWLGAARLGRVNAARAVGFGMAGGPRYVGECGA